MRTHLAQLILLVSCLILALSGCDSNDLKAGNTWYYTPDEKMMAAVTAELELRKIDSYRFTTRQGWKAIAYRVDDKPKVERAIGELIGMAPDGYNGVCSPNGLATDAHREALKKAGIQFVSSKPKFTGEFCVFWAVQDENKVLAADSAYREFKEELSSRHAQK